MEGLPARIHDLRDELPGLEPERHVTDWGRSERVEGAVDRLLLDFLYHYWHRVEIEGIENVPAGDGALLAANHAGAVPLDAALIAKAIRQEHPLGRPLHLSTAPALAGIPGVGMAVGKLGGIPEHPANLHRLLYDEGELVLAFPEGREGPRKPLGRRYRLRPFAPDPVRAAIRARAPVVPVAVLGAEESSPVILRLGGRLLRQLPRVPLAGPLPLPAKVRIRFLEPVPTAELGEDPGVAEQLAGAVRGLIGENLLEMVGARRSLWLG
jgi:1-acyl-sn-glycerol-3-phosphate acyltransferase